MTKDEFNKLVKQYDISKFHGTTQFYLEFRMFLTYVYYHHFSVKRVQLDLDEIQLVLSNAVKFPRMNSHKRLLLLPVNYRLAKASNSGVKIIYRYDSNDEVEFLRFIMSNDREYYDY